LDYYKDFFVSLSFSAEGCQVKSCKLFLSLEKDNISALFFTLFLYTCISICQKVGLCFLEKNFSNFKLFYLEILGIFSWFWESRELVTKLCTYWCDGSIGESLLPLFLNFDTILKIYLKFRNFNKFWMFFRTINFQNEKKSSSKYAPQAVQTHYISYQDNFLSDKKD